MEEEQQLPNMVTQLVDMGFDQEKSKLAYKNTNNSEDIAAIIEYIQNNDELLENQLKNPQQQQSSTEQNKQEGSENKNNDQKQQDDQQQQSISGLVDQAMAQQIMEMGHSKIVAEKALFMTQANKSVEAAIGWIEEHKDDEDFNEELFIVGQQKSKLSPEEARIRAKEMQAELRIKREAIEAQEELEREKRRIEFTKNANKNAELLREANKQREVEQQVRERNQFEMDKKKMEEQLDRDYIERFGMEKFKKWKADKIKETQQVSKIDKTNDCIKAIVTAHPQRVFPDKAMTTLKTLKLYIENIIKNPTEEKFRKVNTQNAGFKKRVGDSFGGQATLECVGFVLDQEGFLVLNNPDIKFLQDVVNALEKNMKAI